MRCTRIIRLAAERICRQWNTSANILRFALHCGQRHGSTSSDRSGSEQEIVQLPDLYASATPHSLCSYGVCSVARSLSRYRLVTHSFRQAAPKPTYAPTAFVLSSARSVLRTSIADNYTSIGCIDLTRCAVRQGINSIPPMTASAALLSSFVRAV